MKKLNQRLLQVNNINQICVAEGNKRIKIKKYRPNRKIHGRILQKSEHWRNMQREYLGTIFTPDGMDVQDVKNNIRRENYCKPRYRTIG